MCEFVADDIDMTTLSQAQKEKLKKDLEDRKKQLEKRAYELGQAIQKIK
jgi:hypothetical protein